MIRSLFWLDNPIWQGVDFLPQYGPGFASYVHNSEKQGMGFIEKPNWDFAVRTEMEAL